MERKELKHHYKLPFLNLNIKYGEEKINFNLLRELRLNPTRINEELQNQPSKYGFCLLLHKKLLTIFETKKVYLRKQYGRLYFQAKERKHKSTGRLFTDDMAKAWVEKHPDYINAQLACIKSKDDADAIYSCIKSFEQRKDVAQSISSNSRNER